jgi:hypothetical protein
MIALLAFALTAAASDPQVAYEAATDAARNGDNSAAIELFVDSVDAGGRDPAVYHGLGNALYREGHAGLAVAAWRRAADLAPRDGDIAANLDRARREGQDRLAVAEGPVDALFWQRWLAPRDSALAGGFLAFIGLAGLLLRRIRRRRNPDAASWGWETPTALGVSALLVASTFAATQVSPGAVVVVPEVSARSALGPDGVELFVLHEGAEVIQEEVAGDHTLIALPDERKGWVSSASLVTTDAAAPFPRP